jgi:hypothetical protein
MMMMWVPHRCATSAAFALWRRQYLGWERTEHHGRDDVTRWCPGPGLQARTQQQRGRCSRESSASRVNLVQQVLESRIWASTLAGCLDVAYMAHLIVRILSSSSRICVLREHIRIEAYHKTLSKACL